MGFLETLGWRSRPKDVEPDPTASSVLPDSIRKLNLVRRNFHGYDVLQDKTGRTYHEIQRSQQDQMFLSRLLKGLMPVSDVVFDQSTYKFYSYQLPEGGIQKDLESDSNLWADVLLLELLFGDDDHDDTNLRDGENWYALFDFEYFHKFWDVKTEHRRILMRSTGMTVHANADQLRALKYKLQQLRVRFQAEDGLQFMQAVLDSMDREGAGCPQVLDDGEDDHDVVHFQQTLMRRIEKVEQLINSLPNLSSAS